MLLTVRYTMNEVSSPGKSILYEYEEAISALEEFIEKQFELERITKALDSFENVFSEIEEECYQCIYALMSDPTYDACQKQKSG